MNNRDWETLGNDIFRTVQEAIESCNYDKLNQNVSDAVGQVVDSVARNVKQTSEHMQQAREKTYSSNYTRKSATGSYEYQRTPYYGSQQVPAVYEAKGPSRVGGILQIVLGGVLGGCSVAAMVAGGVVGTVFGITELYGVTGGAAIFLAIGGMIIGGGIRKLKQVGRFRKYIRAIGEREYCNVKTLTSAVGKNTKYVIKDIEKMMKKGWFKEGHFDKNKTCLILTDSMYQQYQQLEAQKSQMQKEEAQRAEEQRKKVEAERKLQEEQRSKLSPEVQKIIEQGDTFVKKIRECNDSIPGEEVSAKMERMEMIVDRIFDRVEEHPESISDIRKLMDYYLPTTIKLLEAYAQMDAQPIGGENIQAAKREIEATLDTLNVAFEKILDSLFQETAWDVSSDISVLNAILAQEGLKEDGLNNRRN